VLLRWWRAASNLSRHDTIPGMAKEPRALNVAQKNRAAHRLVADEIRDLVSSNISSGTAGELLSEYREADHPGILDALRDLATFHDNKAL
jgi:hypothetical protein